MKTNTLLSMILLFIIGLSFSGCEKDGDEFSGRGPEIEWISGGTSMTYIYSSGAISGYNFKRIIDVIKGSGEIEISIAVKGNDESKATGIFQVEKGKQYKFSIRGGIDGRTLSNPSDQCMTVVFSSPNCRDNYEIKVTSFMVTAANEWVSDTYYCPDNLVLSDIILTVEN